MGEDEANSQAFESSATEVNDTLEVADDAGAEKADALSEPSAGADTADDSTTDPYQERFSAYERRIAQLERALQQRVPQQTYPPAWAAKPQDQWTLQDWQEYNAYVIDQRLQKVTAEQRWSGILSEQAMGRGADYQSVVGRYMEHVAQSDPGGLSFLSNLEPQALYALATVHWVLQHAGGNYVQAFKAIRNAIGARVAGANDVLSKVNSGARRAALAMVRGGAQRRQPLTADDIANMSDEEFRAFEARVTGR